jgi:hypothetical protein
MVDDGRLTVEGGWVRRGFVGILVFPRGRNGSASFALPFCGDSGAVVRQADGVRGRIGGQENGRRSMVGGGRSIND